MKLGLPLIPIEWQKTTWIFYFTKSSNFVFWLIKTHIYFTKHLFHSGDAFDFQFDLRYSLSFFENKQKHRKNTQTAHTHITYINMHYFEEMAVWQIVWCQKKVKQVWGRLWCNATSFHEDLVVCLCHDVDWRQIVQFSNKCIWMFVCVVEVFHLRLLA